MDHGLPGDGRGLLVRGGRLVNLVLDPVRGRSEDLLVYVPQGGVATEAARLDELKWVGHRCYFQLLCSDDVSSSCETIREQCMKQRTTACTDCAALCNQ